VDNITDHALARFQTRYNDDSITKDAIFDYVYGVLHAPSYRKRFANNLNRELPRIPFAPDFHRFAAAGKELATLHLGYETCPESPLNLTFEGEGNPRAADFRIGAKMMKFLDKEKKTTLRVNERILLHGIPQEAHRYEVNGRTPLGWFMDRYRIKRDKRSGILNDPNGWWKDPRDFITAIRRIVWMSVETVRIVGALPDPLEGA